MRSDDWFVTASGRRVHILDPEHEFILIDDIAHALSHICRFGGHCLSFYSVAQHSLLVSRLVPVEHAFAGLMHDAAEAYLGDVIRPLKRLLGAAYGDLEDKWEAAIETRFNIEVSLEAKRAIKHADLLALAAERRELAHPKAHVGLFQDFAHDEAAAAVDVGETRVGRPLGPTEARAAFLTRFGEVTGRRHVCRGDTVRPYPAVVCSLCAEAP